MLNSIIQIFQSSEGTESIYLNKNIWYYNSTSIIVLNMKHLSVRGILNNILKCEKKTAL